MLAYSMHRYSDTDQKSSEGKMGKQKMKLKYEALRIFLALTGIFLTALLTNSQSGDFADKSAVSKQSEKVAVLFQEVPRFPIAKKFLKHKNRNVAAYNAHARR
jgi:hypothetical protein